jgi:hypothetical protein
MRFPIIYGRNKDLSSYGTVAFYFIVLFLATFTSRINAQNWPSEIWHEGRIVLVAGDTLRGLVKYDLQQDLIQYNLSDKRTEAFSARKVLFFEIFDNSVRKYRQFFALPYTTPTGYKAPIFFELLVEGKLTLLSREAVEFRTYNSPYYIGSYSRQVLVNTYFFLGEKGDITEFTGNKNDLLDLMGKRSKDVERYMKTNRLRYEDKYDLARIIAYYNSI